MKVSLASSSTAVAILTVALGASAAVAGTQHDGDHEYRVEKITLTTQNSQGGFPNSTADLYDKKGRKVGFVTTNCVTVDSTPDQTITCHGAYVLEKGEITWQNATRDPSPPYFIAITGGTGRYCDASGQIHVIRTEAEEGGGLYELEVIRGRDCR
ncbi:allene oxide cyclase barrel-like domain-containing protein [Streptomyces cellostaticus]|uniref:allene oxide cyclase barrel-like domain-containing protein n=1 Tax=Streptomyces cellostaticus TaxID=67285 RepID=UPI002026223C|nr:hypothetical protein [Streptomyces cellostaticus]